MELFFCRVRPEGFEPPTPWSPACHAVPSSGLEPETLVPKTSVISPPAYACAP